MHVVNHAYELNILILLVRHLKSRNFGNIHWNSFNGFICDIQGEGFSNSLSNHAGNEVIIIYCIFI